MAIIVKIVPLGINAPSPTTLQRKERNVEVTFLNSVQHCLRFALDLLDGVESATLHAPFEIGGRGRSHTGPCRRNKVNVEQQLFQFESKNSTRCVEGVVSRCIVVMQDPVPVAPQRWSLATDVLSETHQSRAIKFRIHCL